MNRSRADAMSNGGALRGGRRWRTPGGKRAFEPGLGRCRQTYPN